MIIQFTVFYYIYKIDFEIAVADSIVYNFLFAIIGLPVWYVVRYSKSAKSIVFNTAINHLTSLILILLVWISASGFIMRSLYSDNLLYIQFLDNSSIWRIVSGTFLYFILALLYYIIGYYNDLQERTSNEARLEKMIKEAELNMLKSQINPHFLFNSLNSISSLTITNPEKAQEMIIKLSDFLRYSISQPNESYSSLKTELANINRYIDIEKVRFGNKLISEFIIEPESNELKIPVMILQPLFENAIKHGVYESTEPIIIKTICKKNDNYLSISISNNFDSSPKLYKGNGIGLNNIKERLRIIYRQENLLRTKSENNIFYVELLIPQS